MISDLFYESLAHSLDVNFELIGAIARCGRRSPGPLGGESTTARFQRAKGQTK